MEKFLPVICASPLFAGIAEADCAAMLKCLGAAVKGYEKGEMVFLEGQPVRQVGVVCEGQVQVLREDARGDRSLLLQAFPGDLFAEAYSCALVEHLPVTVQAAERSQVLLLDYRRIITMCSSACAFHSRMVSNMLTGLARKNIQLAGRMDILSRRTTREKLLTYLSQQASLAGGDTFTVPVDRQELADLLCVERSAMSAELSRMRRDGLVDYRKDRFTLLV